MPRRKLSKTPLRRSKRSSYGARVLGDSPVAFWRLDDKTGRLAADSSGHDNTGLYLGAPGLGAPPMLADSDASVQFDGRDDGINFPDAASLSSSKAISVEAWVSADAVPTSSISVWQLISKWDTALLYVQGGKSPKFVFALYEAASSSFGSVVMSTTTVVASTVYHLVGTYDGSKLRLYVNGELEGTIARRGSLNDSALGGAIAAEGWGDLPSPRFQGRLSEIAIYTTALTQAKVRAHFRAGTSG